MNTDINTNAKPIKSSAPAKASIQVPEVINTPVQPTAKTNVSPRAQRIAARGYALPLALTCNVTGKTVRYTSPSYIEKCISKYGSLEELRKHYVSREGKRESKATVA